jgi:Domain of unknown function (DUF1887)
MKRILLTWYGITDLKAALGFEENGGPILAALMTREYTHVLVLGYTDPLKTESVVQAAQQNYLATKSAEPGAVNPNHAKQIEVVDAFANTPAGHKIFFEWMRAEIRKHNLQVKSHILDIELESLNDSKGIYDAAAQALNIAVDREGDKEVTLYLSPGTPVMAFTWAFVALMNPALKLRVIVAPDPRRPPVQVEMPYSLLDPARRELRQADLIDDSGFDAIVHLFGEQRLPSLFGILQFPSKQHVFVTDPKYPADCMRPFLPPSASFTEVHVDPFDPMSAHDKILGALAALPDKRRIGFNLTGGTKLMFAGAQVACRKVGGIPFYFERRDQSLMFLDDFSTVEVRGLDNVEMFVRLSGCRVSRQGFWKDNPLREQRRAMTTALWAARSRIRRIYERLAEEKRFGPRPFKIEGPAVIASLDGDWHGCIRLGKLEYTVDDCPDFASYLCGGWLEEYVYMHLEPALREGRLRDLRIGLEASWHPRSDDVEPSKAQEFDVALTDGRRLLIIECKAGRVTNDDIYKLENVVRNYGGVEARGVLVSALRPADAQVRRLQGAKNLSFLCDNEVPLGLTVKLLEILGSMGCGG